MAIDIDYQQQQEQQEKDGRARYFACNVGAAIYRWRAWFPIQFTVAIALCHAIAFPDDEKMDEKRCDILACAQMLTASYSFIYRSEPNTEKVRKN